MSFLIQHKSFVVKHLQAHTNLNMASSGTKHFVGIHRFTEKGMCFLEVSAWSWVLSSAVHHTNVMTCHCAAAFVRILMDDWKLKSCLGGTETSVKEIERPYVSLDFPTANNLHTYKKQNLACWFRLAMHMFTNVVVLVLPYSFHHVRCKPSRPDTYPLTFMS